MAESQLIKKLRIKSGQRIAILHAPSGYRELLGELPEGVTVSDVLDGSDACSWENGCEAEK